ncbi:MAG: S-layer family protein [Rivularia sp. ALOHA_DT_140]|nr:S-layer family protein [Rivularia sp. ALOHA_DT_140]
MTIKNTAGIYGIQSRKEPSFNTSDITVKGATPDLEGNIQINPPELDPSRGLIELPVDVVDASNQISNACGPGGSQFENEFVITGRGGLPMSPFKPLEDTSTVSPEWVKLKPQLRAKINRAIKAPLITNSSSENKTKKRKRIVEATGWIVDKDGNIEFTARANQINPQTTSPIPPSCSATN